MCICIYFIQFAYDILEGAASGLVPHKHVREVLESHPSGVCQRELEECAQGQKTRPPARHGTWRGVSGMGLGVTSSP